MRRSVIAGAVVAALGCSCAREVEAPKLRVLVRAQPSAAGLTVFDGSRELGRLDGTGELRVETRPGASHRLGVRCPSGAAAKPVELVIPDDPRAPPSVAELTCQTVEHVLLVLVSTRAAGLPVIVDGTEHARTDADGFAWVRLQKPAGETAQIGVDPSGTRWVAEASSRTFRFEERDELAVLPVALAEARVPGRPRSTPQPSPGPYRLR